MILTSITLVFALFGLLFSGVWIAVVMLFVGVIGVGLFADSNVSGLMTNAVWTASTTWTLTPLPLFIWMGEILHRSDIGKRMFEGLAPWLDPVPGRLLHVNVAGSAIFAAVCGSSAATTMTVGRISLPELGKRNYPRQITLGSLCGASTLGLMIPPSIMMIVYGVAAEVSIGKLFIAGVVPGIILAFLFSGYIAVWSILNKSAMAGIPAEPKLSFGKKIRRSLGILPIIGLIVTLIGALYGGLVTATEAAALGVLGALVINWWTGNLNWQTFLESVRGAVIASCTLLFILAFAAFLAVTTNLLGLPQALSQSVASWGLSPIGVLAAITVVYIVLGCFLDGISMVLITATVILPLVESSGFNLVWFGIYVVIVCEMAQITPPVGFNLFAIKTLTEDSVISIGKASLPFFGILLLAIVIIYVWPELVLFLPDHMTAK